MQKRGCFFLEDKAALWRKENWQGFYEREACVAVTREKQTEGRHNNLWERYLSSPGYRGECRNNFARGQVANHGSAPVGWVS